MTSMRYAIGESGTDIEWTDLSVRTANGEAFYPNRGRTIGEVLVEGSAQSGIRYTLYRGSLGFAAFAQMVEQIEQIENHQQAVYGETDFWQIAPETLSKILLSYGEIVGYGYRKEIELE